MKNAKFRTEWQNTDVSLFYLLSCCFPTRDPSLPCFWWEIADFESWMYVCKDICTDFRNFSNILTNRSQVSSAILAQSFTTLWYLRLLPQIKISSIYCRYSEKVTGRSCYHLPPQFYGKKQICVSVTDHTDFLSQTTLPLPPHPSYD
jgi:hypothetical protein